MPGRVQSNDDPTPWFAETGHPHRTRYWIDRSPWHTALRATQSLLNAVTAFDAPRMRELLQPTLIPFAAVRILQSSRGKNRYTKRRATDIIRRLESTPFSKRPTANLPASDMVDFARLETRSVASLFGHHHPPHLLHPEDIVVTFPLEPDAKAFLRHVFGWFNKGTLIVRASAKTRILAL